MTRAYAACLLLGAVALGGCAQQPQQLAAAGHSKEYFPSSVYGPASRRVIADGEPVPHGGGQYLVGRPYTIAGQTYYPSERRITQVGFASWYGDAFHGRLTANGEIYDRDSFTAAHPTMPLPSYARVTNLRNNSSMVVRVNDRGPYHSNRVMDVSRRVADALDIRRYGTAKVKVEWLARASLAGSDDTKLMATLRTGSPASLDGVEAGIRVATAPVRAVVASLGNFVPAPARPTRIIEQERPDALEAYRASPRNSPRRAQADDRTPSALDERRDQRRTTPGRSPHPRIEEAEDVENWHTGSLPHRGEHAHVPSLERTAPGRHEIHVASRDLGSATHRTIAPEHKSGDARRAGTPMPPLRRPAVGSMARAIPPVRPARLALVSSHDHARATAPRGRSLAAR